MSPSLNNFCNEHILLSILIATLLAFCFYTLLHIWSRMSEYCGLLYKDGWKKFTRKWNSWDIIKKLLFIIMYTITILGWIVVGTFIILVSILAAVTVANYFSNKSKV